MKPLRLALAVLVATVLIPAAPAQARALTDPTLRVMPLGDSITAGSHSVPNYVGYRGRLGDLVRQQARYRIDFVGSSTVSHAIADPQHEGHSSQTIAYLRDNIDGFMDAAQPDVVLLLAGINDLKYDRTATTADVVSRLDSLVNRIIFKRPNVTIVLSGLLAATPGVQAEIAVVNAGARAIAEREVGEGNKVRYVEMPVTAAQLADNLHPDNDGYRVMADTFFTALNRVVNDGWAHGPYHSFNGDARADLVVHTDADLTVREAVPTGGFQPGGTSVSADWGQFHGLDLPGGRGELHYADFDGDGRTDLLVHDGTNVGVRLNDGAGGFGPATNVTSGYGRYHGLHVPDGLGQLYFADINGDGRADLVVHDGTNVNVRLNTGTGVFSGVVTTATTGYGRFHGLHVPDGLGRLYFADFDGDGRDDLIVHNGTTVDVRINNGAGRFGTETNVTSGYGRYHGLRMANGLGRLYFADYDGDGRDDLVVHDGTNVNVRLAGPDGKLSAVRTVTTGYGRYHGMQISGGLGTIAFA
ncbi:FG-GAP-like repeat-containing protein [Actinoplanes sp. G11-F43]|uniref:FG-GAP-like repeat-containing protein n=1 Tax=Actinoplanes sp. G11-F43 TaxID=3424130 RepID=UPI003D341C2D